MLLQGKIFLIEPRYLGNQHVRVTSQVSKETLADYSIVDDYQDIQVGKDTLFQ